MIARKWVFPIIWIVIFSVITAALVKLAFFAEPSDTATPEVPTGELIEPMVPVAVGTIRNDVIVDGQVNSDPAKPLRATFAGEVVDVFGDQGDSVKKGKRAVAIRGFTTGSKPKEVTETVDYPASGTLSSLTVLEDQSVEVGDVLGQIAPASFNVSGTLAPEQLYRLLEQPDVAQVTVTGGPAPFTCDDLTISTPLAGADEGEGSDPGAGGGGGSTTVSCDVPREVTVFPGLTAQLALAGGIAENVLTLPVTAVLGSAGTGVVYLAGPDGEPVETPVTLGLTDGVGVEITGGVAEGDQVLQFVPGADAGVGDGAGGGVFVDGGVIEGDVVR